MRIGQSLFGILVLVVALCSAAMRLRAHTEEVSEAVVVHAMPTLSPVAPPVRAGLPAPRPQEMSPRFSELMQKTWEHLPVADNLKGVSDEDLHFAPPGLMQAAEGLGKIVQEIKSNPGLIPSGIEFFRSCAEKREVYDSVRAVCYRNLQYWASQANPPVKVDPESFPEEIRGIAAGLPAYR